MAYGLYVLVFGLQTEYMGVVSKKAVVMSSYNSVELIIKFEENKN